MELQQGTVEMAAKAADVSGKVSYFTSVSAVFAGITLNDIAIVVGIVATVVTAGVNWYYRAKHARLIEARVKADGVVIDDES